MNVYLRRRTVAFIVRVWAEYLEQAPLEWRGEVECIGSGRRFTFGSLDELVEFLQSQAAAGPEGKGRASR